jgi:AraC-like DNA-binding protein
VLRLPGAMLRTTLRNTEALTASTVSGRRGAGHLLIGMIRNLTSDIHSLAPESASAVAESVTQILIAGLSGLPAAKREPVSHLTAYHRERIRACVRSRLHEPDLNVAVIAAELGLSPSSVHRAWQGEDCTIADWIWAQRLEATRRALGDVAHRGESISTIAFAWGFNDAAHFSRAFRGRFGCSAREWRAAQWNA